MNKLANKEQGFTIGHRVASQTKGILAWCKLHPKQTDTVLLLLDVEGMADVKKEGDNHHDIKLFCLVNLLSSVIIYNHQGIFDQDTLEKLAFITRMAENIRNTDDLAPDVNDETLRLLTSMFIMCLRDFHLQLEEDNRRFKNADEYFESVIELSAEPGHETNDKTKMCIQKYYPKRKCFIIRQPAMNEHLTRLEELDEKRLDRDFLAEVNNLKEFVYGCKPKLLDAVTKKLANGLVALAKGESMTFSAAFIRASKYHYGKLVIKLVNEYKEEVDKISLPKKKKQDLQDKCFKLQNKKLHIFRRQSYPYEKWHFEDKAWAKMEIIACKKMNENSKKVQWFFAQISACIHEESMRRPAIKYQDSGLSMIKEVENLFLLETKGFDNDEQAVAFHKYKKSIKHEQMKAESAAKLREEEKRKGK